MTDKHADSRLILGKERTVRDPSPSKLPCISGVGFIVLGIFVLCVIITKPANQRTGTNDVITPHIGGALYVVAEQRTSTNARLPAEMLRLEYVVAAWWLAMACGYKEVYPPVDRNATTTPLYLALMMSFGGGFNSSGTVPGIKIALDRVNQDPSILPGYTLHYTLLDSEVSAFVTIKDVVVVWKSSVVHAYTRLKKRKQRA